MSLENNTTSFGTGADSPVTPPADTSAEEAQETALQGAAIPPAPEPTEMNGYAPEQPQPANPLAADGYYPEPSQPANPLTADGYHPEPSQPANPLTADGYYPEPSQPANPLTADGYYPEAPQAVEPAEMNGYEAEEEQMDVSEEMKRRYAAEEDDFPWERPVVPQPVCVYYDDIAGFCFSQQGESHIAAQTPCQDRCKMLLLKKQSIYVLAIADGVGSCELSDFGADTATDAIVQYLGECIQDLFERQGITALDKTIVGKLLREAMQKAYDAVEQRAAEMQQMLFSLQSTLTAAIYDGKDLYFAHAGDDGILALTRRGEMMMVTNRHKGEEASSVYPLQSKATWQFGMVPDTAAFVMATDGVLDSFISSGAENNRVYYPFIEDIFATPLHSEKDVAALTKSYFDLLHSENYRKMVRDDLTLAAIVNCRMMVSTKKPVFDSAAWERDSQLYAQKRRAALYPDFHTKKPPVQTAGSPQPSPSSVTAPATRSQTVYPPSTSAGSRPSPVPREEPVANPFDSPFISGPTPMGRTGDSTSAERTERREHRRATDGEIRECGKCGFRNPQVDTCMNCGASLRLYGSKQKKANTGSVNARPSASMPSKSTKPQEKRESTWTKMVRFFFPDEREE